MPDRESTKYQDSYIRDLQDIADDYYDIAELFAEGWVHRYETSGMNLQRYLQDFSGELGSITHELHLKMGPGFAILPGSFSEYLKLFEDEYHNDSLVGMMLRTNKLSDLKTLYEGRNHEDNGKPGILYIRGLLDYIGSIKGRDDPGRFVDEAHKITEWEVPGGEALMPVFRALIDTNIAYNLGTTVKTLDRSKALLPFAATDITRRALNNALDYKVVRAAASVDDSVEQTDGTILLDQTPRDAFLEKYASSEIAKQAMSRYLSLKRKPGPQHGHRRNVVTAEAVREFRLRRIERKTEERRKRQRTIDSQKTRLAEALEDTARDTLAAMGYANVPDKTFRHIRTFGWLAIDDVNGFLD